MSPPWQWEKDTQATDDEAAAYRAGRDDVVERSFWWQVPDEESGTASLWSDREVEA